MKKERILDIFIPIFSIVLIIAVWSIGSLAVGSEYVLPSVFSTVKEMINLLGTGEFYLSLAGTFLRSVIAFAIAFILAFAVAVFSKKNKNAERFFSPLVSVTRALPTVAIVLLLLFWTNSFVAPVIVTLLVVFPTVYTNLFNALDSVDDKNLKMCKLFNVSKKDVLKKVQIPFILPQVYKSVGSGLSLNLKLMVAAEVLSSTAHSLGYLLNTAKAYFEIATMIALVVFSVILGLVIELIFNVLSLKSQVWK